MSSLFNTNMNVTAPAAENVFLVEAARRWPTAATALLACVLVFVTQYVFKGDSLANLPIVGIEFGGTASRRKKFNDGEARNLYLDGYRKFKEQAFQITSSRESTTIVVAPKFMDELKRLPDDTLSLSKASDEILHSKYTGVQTDTNFVPHTVKTRLTPSLGRLNPIIHDEVDEAMRTELPQSGEWTKIKVQDKLMRVIARASGRVFIGPELCRSEDYLDPAINYTVDVMNAVRRLADMQPYLRPFLSLSRPEVRAVRKRMDEALKLLKPVIKARREGVKDPEYQKPEDMLQWMMDSQEKFGQKDDKAFAKVQLTLSFAAIHTTSATTINALYTLAAMPEIVPILREDVQQALAETDGVFTNIAMQNMKKLDSFLKECTRYYSMGPSSFMRKVLKTFTLSNGQVIPAGSVIEAPAIGIYTDNEFFPDADKFDPLRFYKLRLSKTEYETGSKQAEVVANAQFVSVGQSSLHFGYGRHACPGRFFAVNEMKMIMATFLLNYEVMNVGGSRERCPNLIAGSMCYPDPDGEILIRKL